MDLDEFLKSESLSSLWDAPHCLPTLLTELDNLAEYISSRYQARFTNDATELDVVSPPLFLHVFVDKRLQTFEFEFMDFLEQSYEDRNTQHEHLKNATGWCSDDRGTIHHPPEMEKARGDVSLKGEVWTLACYTIRILTRALLGKEGLDQFDHARIQVDQAEKIGFFYCDEVGGRVLNGAVDKWLDSLVDMAHPVGASFYSLCPDIDLLEWLSMLLRKALAINEKDRCNATELFDTLGDAIDGMMETLDNRPGISPVPPYVQNPIMPHADRRVSRTVDLIRIMIDHQEDTFEHFSKSADKPTKVNPEYVPQIMHWLGDSTPDFWALYEENDKDISRCLYSMASQSEHRVVAYSPHIDLYGFSNVRHVLASLFGQLLDEKIFEPRLLTRCTQ